MGERKRGAATNSILLAFVQCLTMLSGIIQTMILSRGFSEAEYGTYAQGMLVVNFLGSFLLLGLSNAVTYFSGQKEIDTHKYTGAIITIVILLGTIGGIGILLAREGIVDYFGNGEIRNIIAYVAFLPLLTNVITVYQTLFIAENMATSIAVKNAIVSVSQVIIIAIGTLVAQSIKIIYILVLVMDISQIVIFAVIFRNRRYSIHIVFPTKDISGPILKYSIPLALSTAIGTISIYMDKLLIGNLMDIESFALYTNMAKELPFAFIINSFTTVLMPVFIRLHAEGEDPELKKHWANYLELGYSITWILTGTAVFCSKNLLLFLYSEKYEQGLNIFIIYLFVEMCRFSYFGTILSTFGKTKVIMYSSLLSLTCNFVLNLLFYHLFGIIGPAIASFVSVLLMLSLQLKFSCKLLQCRIKDVFRFKSMLLLLGEIFIVGGIIQFAGSLINISYVFKLFICGGLMVSILGLLNYKRIKLLIRNINRI